MESLKINMHKFESICFVHLTVTALLVSMEKLPELSGMSVRNPTRGGQQTLRYLHDHSSATFKKIYNLSE